MASYRTTEPKYYTKMCSNCWKLYPDIFMKCPNCGCKDWETPFPEIKTKFIEE